MSGGESGNKVTKRAALNLDPASLEEFIKSGFEGAENLRNLQHDYYDIEGQDSNAGLVKSYNEFTASTKQARETYVKRKTEAGGRDLTLLVPPETSRGLL